MCKKHLKIKALTCLTHIYIILYRAITVKRLCRLSIDRKEVLETMKLITLHLPEPYIRALDQLVTEQFYPNRAEAIREAIRDMLTTEVWERKKNGWRKVN